MLVGTFVGDTGAYFGGRAFGARRWRRGSRPTRRSKGSSIGIVAGVAAVWFTGLYQDWLSGQQALLLGAAVAVAAPLGDLFESYLKRDAGTKDTGTLFGAHGGALDRLDAAMFAVGRRLLRLVGDDLIVGGSDRGERALEADLGVRAVAERLVLEPPLTSRRTRRERGERP